MSLLDSLSIFSFWTNIFRSVIYFLIYLTLSFFWEARRTRSLKATRYKTLTIFFIFKTNFWKKRHLWRMFQYTRQLPTVADDCLVGVFFKRYLFIVNKLINLCCWNAQVGCKSHFFFQNQKKNCIVFFKISTISIWF